MKKFLITLLYALSVLQPTAALAEVTNTDCESPLMCEMRKNNRPEGTNSDRPVTGFTETSTQSQFGTTGAAHSCAYAQAQEAKSQANTMMIAALAMAAIMFSQCGPHNQMACVLGAAALGAAAIGMSKKNDAQRLMNDLGTGQDTVARPEDDENKETDGNVTSDGDVTAMQDKYKTKGYTVNSDGSVTLPNGNTVAGDFSEQGMLDAGMSKADASGVASGLAKMRDDIGKKGSEVAGGAGGLSGASLERSSLDSMSGNGETASGGVGTSVNGANKVEATRDPASWDGYFKQYGDSLIGVGQNDIFSMVIQRVEKERKMMGQ